MVTTTILCKYLNTGIKHRQFAYGHSSFTTVEAYVHTFRPSTHSCAPHTGTAIQPPCAEYCDAAVTSPYVAA